MFYARTTFFVHAEKVTAKALAPPFGMEIHQRSTSEEGQ